MIAFQQPWVILLIPVTNTDATLSLGIRYHSFSSEVVLQSRYHRIESKTKASDSLVEEDRGWVQECQTSGTQEKSQSGKKHRKRDLK